MDDVPQEQAGWGPLASLVVVVMGFVVAQLVGVLLLLIVVGIFGDRSSLDEPAYIFLGNAFINACLFAIIYGFIRWRKRSLRSIGLRPPKPKDMIAALGGYAIYFVAFVVVNLVFTTFAPEVAERNQDLGFSREASGPVLGIIFVSLVILPPLVEEIMFRGFLFAGLRRRFNWWHATIFTSLLFGLAHLFGGENGQLVWLSAIDTFILSVVLCHLREQTRGLWAPILLHGSKNLVAFAVLFIFKVG